MKNLSSKKVFFKVKKIKIRQFFCTFDFKIQQKSMQATINKQIGKKWNGGRKFTELNSTVQRIVKKGWQFSCNCYVFFDAMQQ